MKKVVIITSNQLRHTYLRTMFAWHKEISVLRTYVEYSSSKQEENSLDPIEVKHFFAREMSEEDFFSGVIKSIDDLSNSVEIEKNLINEERYISEIRCLNVDYIVTFGCCILRGDFLKEFKGKIINVHLGISPYYLGAGTNFHSIINGDFQCTGYTFMFMDEGIDTGEVIHQARARIFPFDNVHQIGNRLIKDMVQDFTKLISKFELVNKMEPIRSDYEPITCFIKDSTLAKTKELYKKFQQGAVEKYLSIEDKKIKDYPIIEQDFMKARI